MMPLTKINFKKDKGVMGNCRNFSLHKLRHIIMLNNIAGIYAVNCFEGLGGGKSCKGTLLP